MILWLAAALLLGTFSVLWVLSTRSIDNEVASSAPESSTSTTTSSLVARETTAPPAVQSTSTPEATAVAPAVSRSQTSSLYGGIPFSDPTGSIYGGIPFADPSTLLEAAPPSTTTTVAPPPTAAPSSGPAPVRIARPSCAAGLGSPTTRTAPFTGQTASIPSNLPGVVVKVSNNNQSSRSALIGLDQADVVFEERIEASATRFFALFHSSLPANVGPVRSGRTTDIELTQNLNRPVFGYSGSNDGVARQIQSAAAAGQLTPFINTDRSPFARDGRFRAPDNLFVDPSALGACGGGGNPTPIFSYGAASSTTAQPASSVSLSARSSYRFDWNGSGWTRSQSGSVHTTRTGALIDPQNVVVMFVPYVRSQVDAASVDADTTGSGTAWILRDGTITIGNWSRSRGSDPYTYTDGNGGRVNLAPGQTWVVLAPGGTASWN